MQKLFQREEAEALSEQVERWSTFILVNVLWALLAVPLVTLPAATAGLVKVMLVWVRGGSPDLGRDFFAVMRAHWRGSTLLMVGNVLVGGLLLVNLSIFPHMDLASDPIAFVSRSLTVFGLIMLGMVNIYAWPLLVSVDLPVLQVVKISFSWVMLRPFWSVGVLAAALVPLLLGALLPAFILVFFATGCTAWAATWGAWQVMRRFVTDSAEDTQA